MDPVFAWGATHLLVLMGAALYLWQLSQGFAPRSRRPHPPSKRAI